MRVSKLTNTNDWIFGRGKASYIIKSDAIKQNVQTRLRSFKNDWFPSMQEGIDWLTLLGNFKTENQIRKEVERIITKTYGIAKIINLNLSLNRQNRELTITVILKDVFSNTLTINTSVS